MFRPDEDEGGRRLPQTPPMTRRWTINGDFTTLSPTGVARYAREVTLALDALLDEGHPLTLGLSLDLVMPRPPAGDLGLQAIPTRLVPEYARPRLPQFWVQAQLPRHVPGGLLSFCNLAPVGVRRQIVCIHDLQTFTSPASYSRGFRLAHRVVLPLLGRRAAAVTTVSSLSRDDLVRFGVAPAEKIVVTYNGSDHARGWKPERSTLRLGGERPFALCLLRNQPHKNPDLLIRLARPLDALGVDLVMMGQLDAELEARVQREGAPNIRLLGRISDDDFAAVLKQALCFLFPSRTEGFGLPVVEAMSWGCPVISSNAPCLPEVCGEAALFADPDDDAAWVAAVQRVLADAPLHRRLAAAGRERAAYFSWRRIAVTYLGLMAGIDAKDPVTA
ncbi:glycosyltransferase family 4 protein [Ancylobacter sp. 6x-1]|uniref:Glycosyltransferase family 4 protein n=1 Tax=Ancylobacter crimeensis TaxID=2579147 RepID=A0ABT0DBF3_9HYPH|nr:glycosyltransferase family 1 protein [Ancylobacter crimeensis]MCK0197270.1 glycosyltransferase family 4 protein [Ancylobacter crimeensis]